MHDEILRRAGVEELDCVTAVAERVKAAFSECKRELLSTCDAVLASQDDKVLPQVQEQVMKLNSHISDMDFLKVQMPTQVRTHDMRAIQGGLQSPPHLRLQAWLCEMKSTAQQARTLAESARYAASYLRKLPRVNEKSLARTGDSIFIGHGHSPAWKDLKDLLVDRLGLEYEEFNREPTAGRSTKERLLELLDRCNFAFLVMTGEDERVGGSRQARQNVIHEVGLFQARHGFERAVVLLEDGCEEFSNIQGIGQIRFPKGKITAASEEIRRVLEREGILTSR